MSWDNFRHYINKVYFAFISFSYCHETRFIKQCVVNREGMRDWKRENCQFLLADGSITWLGTCLLRSELVALQDCSALYLNMFLILSDTHVHKSARKTLTPLNTMRSTSTPLQITITIIIFCLKNTSLIVSNRMRPYLYENKTYDQAVVLDWIIFKMHDKAAADIFSFILFYLFF